MISSTFFPPFPDKGPSALIPPTTFGLHLAPVVPPAVKLLLYCKHVQLERLNHSTDPTRRVDRLPRVNKSPGSNNICAKYRRGTLLLRTQQQQAVPRPSVAVMIWHGTLSTGQVQQLLSRIRESPNESRTNYGSPCQRCQRLWKQRLLDKVNSAMVAN